MIMPMILYDIKEADKVVNAWLKTPPGESIPLMRDMRNYGGRALLGAAFDYKCDDDQLLTGLQNHIDYVSFLQFTLLSFFLL